MSDHSYETDALAWSEHQVALLRQLAAGHRVNEPIDWANVIEEVQDVGLSELRSCRSLLRQAILHLMKLHAWPESRSTGHWGSEAIGFMDDARDRFSPSMRQRIELSDVYEAALRGLATATDESGHSREVRPSCPYSLDELIAKTPDLPTLAAKLAA